MGLDALITNFMERLSKSRRARFVINAQRVVQDSSAGSIVANMELAQRKLRGSLPNALI